MQYSSKQQNLYWTQFNIMAELALDTVQYPDFQYRLSNVALIFRLRVPVDKNRLHAGGVLNTICFSGGLSIKERFFSLGK